MNWEVAYDNEHHKRLVAEAEVNRLREENMRLQGRLAATQDHHDAEHERCARRDLEGSE